MDAYVRQKRRTVRIHIVRRRSFPNVPRAATGTAHAAAVTTASVTTAVATTAAGATARAAHGDRPRTTGGLDPSRSRAPPPAAAPPALRTRSRPSGPAGTGDRAGPADRHVVPVDHADAADLRRHVGRVLRLALEVLDGRRPARPAPPASGAAGPAVHARRAGAGGRPLREPSRMTSLHLGRPAPGAEVAVVYRRGRRARALAARFEPTRPGRAPRAGTADRGRSDRRPSPATGREWRCVTLRLL